MLRGYSSSQDLVEKQTDEELKKLSPKILLTLAGIKMLKIYFKENAREWRFVVAKAIQQVKAKCGPDASVDALCDKLTIVVAF
jgi:hypothetical protein